MHQHSCLKFCDGSLQTWAFASDGACEVFAWSCFCQVSGPAKSSHHRAPRFRAHKDQSGQEPCIVSWQKRCPPFPLRIISNHAACQAGPRRGRNLPTGNWQDTQDKLRQAPRQHWCMVPACTFSRLFLEEWYQKLAAGVDDNEKPRRGKARFVEVTCKLTDHSRSWVHQHAQVKEQSRSDACRNLVSRLYNAD